MELFDRSKTSGCLRNPYDKKEIERDNERDVTKKRNWRVK